MRLRWRLQRNAPENRPPVVAHRLTVASKYFSSSRPLTAGKTRSTPTNMQRLDAAHQVTQSTSSLTATSSAGTKSRLEALPPELRDDIYERALTVPFTIKLSRPTQLPGMGMKSPLPKTQVLALTTVSRAIRDETLGLFYSLNNSAFIRNGVDWIANCMCLSEKQARFDDDLATLGPWLRGLRSSGVKKLGGLCIDVATWDVPFIPGHWQYRECWGQLHNTIRSVVMNQGLQFTQLSVCYQTTHGIEGRIVNRRIEIVKRVEVVRLPGQEEEEENAVEEV